MLFKKKGQPKAPKKSAPARSNKLIKSVASGPIPMGLGDPTSFQTAGPGAAPDQPDQPDPISDGAGAADGNMGGGPQLPPNGLKRGGKVRRKK